MVPLSRQPRETGVLRPCGLPRFASIHFCFVLPRQTVRADGDTLVATVGDVKGHRRGGSAHDHQQPLTPTAIDASQVDTDQVDVIHLYSLLPDFSSLPLLESHC
jgi:hypothetical protein